VLLICQRQGLIGREMFAIDGVKLPSNASKAKSGKRKDFMRQAAKREQAVQALLAKQRDNDAAGSDARLAQREQRQIERLGREANKIAEWLQQHPRERKSAKGKVRLSNRTDNESAKMATGKGVVQGYTGVAAVDEKHQGNRGRTSPRQRLGARAARPDHRGTRGRTRAQHRAQRRQRLLQQEQPQRSGSPRHRGVHPRPRVSQA
jgi:hypothetical protein